MIHVLLLCLSSRRCCVALHPFGTVFPGNQPSAPAASFGPGQSYASLLEHWEPVCPPRLVLHPPSPPFPQHWGWKLPVDYRGWIVVLNQKSSRVKTDKSGSSPVLLTFLQLQVIIVMLRKDPRKQRYLFLQVNLSQILGVFSPGGKNVYILLHMDESE